MRSQSNPYCLILTAFGVLSLLFLSSCTQSDSGDTTTDIAVQPVPIGGKNIANFDNARISCGFTGEAGRYRVDCRLTAIDSSGSERTADEVVPGLEINWQDPKLLSGPELRGLSCTVASSQLSQSCEVILDASQMAKLQFSNLIRDTLSQRSREESQIVTLPLEITTYGLTPEMGRRIAELSLDKVTGAVEKAGFQTVEIPANSQNFKITGFCLNGDDIYFASGITIFRAQKKQDTGEYFVTLWAGSTTVSNLNNFSHRLRVHMGLRDNGYFSIQKAVEIACLPDAIAVLDPNNNRIFKMRQEGSVEKIAGFGEAPLKEGAVAEGVSLQSDFLLRNLNVGPEGEIHFNYRGMLYRIRSGKLQRVAGSDAPLSNPTLGTSIRSLGSTARDSYGLGKDGRVYLLAQRGSGISGTASYYFVAANPEGIIEKVLILDSFFFIYAVNAAGDIPLLMGRYQVFAFIDGELRVLAGVEGIGHDLSEGSFTTPQPINLVMAAQSGGILWIASGERISRVTPNMLSAYQVEVVVGIKTRSSFIYPKEVPAGTAILPQIDVLETASDGSVYFLDAKSRNVGRIGADHLLRTVAGTGVLPEGEGVNGKPATETDFYTLANFALAPNGDLWLFEAVPTEGIRTRIVSKETQTVSTGENTLFGNVTRFGPDGKLYASDFGSLRRMDPTTGVVEVIVDGNTLIPLASGEDALTGWIRGFTFGGPEEIFFSEERYGRICRTYLDDEGVRRFETIAGNGTKGYSGDGGLALDAQFQFPKSLARDKNGNIYVVAGDYLSRAESRLRLLRPTPQGYTVETLFGGNLAESVDCGSGVIKKDLHEGQMSVGLKSTLGTICPGLIFEVSVRDRCDTEGKKTLIFSQRFDSDSTQSTLVRVEQPCE